MIYLTFGKSGGKMAEFKNNSMIFGERDTKSVPERGKLGNFGAGLAFLTNHSNTEFANP
jgi:hypothetical protein